MLDILATRCYKMKIVITRDTTYLSIGVAHSFVLDYRECAPMAKISKLCCLMSFPAVYSAEKVREYGVPFRGLDISIDVIQNVTDGLCSFLESYRPVLIELASLDQFLKYMVRKWQHWLFEHSLRLPSEAKGT